MKKILLVDDNKGIGLMTALLLRDEGYEVETRTDVQEGIEYFQSFSQNLSLVLLDLNIKQKNDGLQLLEYREKHPELKRVRVMVVSGNNISDVPRSIELADEFVPKKISSEELLARILKLIDG